MGWVTLLIVAPGQDADHAWPVARASLLML